MRRTVCVIAATAGLLLAGCGDDDGEPDPHDGGAAETSTPSSTSTTQPPASESGAVRPYIEDLLTGWDEAMTEILADPEPVETDPAHPLRVALAEHFTADSPYVEDLGLLLEGYTSQDVASMVPRSGDLLQETTLTHFTQASADDPEFVSFVFCSYSDLEVTLSSGDSRPPEVTITRGAGEARRVDGAWRLHRLRRLGRETEPADAPDPCPGMIVEDEDG